MNAKNLPDAVKNQSLFSNYYLDSLIVEQPQWADTPNIESDYAAIKALFDAVPPNAAHLNEAQTEHEFIQPLLEQLGHTFEVQPSLQTSQGTRVPDYAFFPSQDAHDAARSQINTNEFFKTALAVGDAKKWSRNLDRKTQDGGDPFNNQNPNYQIDSYLRDADKDWGILTNGRQWRLYHRQTSYRLDSFYEVDLATLLSENGDLETFRYFYCLFRRDAFIPDSSGTSFLDLVLGESQQYTVAVSDDLKNRVYDALRLLIDGFLNFPRNGFDAANPPLGKIHTNCLILLYRVLFILYAESRGLLPLDNRDYAMQYSLDHLATDIHQKLDSNIAFAPGASLYWTGLRQLFTLINDGWKDHIPQYNGGLFNSQQHPFLERYGIGDDPLAQVIELLTRTEEGEHIAYRDLDVRHLGDIYEGLLEYQPRIASEDLVIVSKRGGETVEPKSSPDQEVAYPEGEVYLLTDNDERKATGSYYTPDYIVRYIVENTLGPLCENKTVDQILSLKILDPATGSGHFLVGVVDYLAEELITHPSAPHMTETASEETELAYWRRCVVESCVYGVDLNPMAVELAKLSLWLHTVAKGEPLSFLDHHIRCGNSLIGAKIKNLSNLPELRRSRRNTSQSQTEIPMEFPFTDRVATAIGHYLLIEETESRTADQIHAKEHQLDIVQQMLRFHKGVANLLTSVYFGNDVSRSTYHQALNALRSRDSDALEDLLSYRRAQEVAKEKRFFHWEIEFPEVFRDKYGREKDNPGFDAVVGNPPYIRQEELGDRKPFLETYQTYSSFADLYVYFIEQAHELVRKHGRFGMITSNKFMRANYGRGLRLYLLTNTALNEIVDFGELPVFEDAAAMTAILLAQRESVDAQAFRFTQMQTLDFDSLEAEINRIGKQLNQEALGENWTLVPADEIRILNKIRENSTTLTRYCEGEIRRGVTTGFNEAFIIDAETRNYLIDEDPRSAEIIKPCVAGDDIRKYEIQFRERYLIWTYIGVPITQYPAVFNHLQQFEGKLVKRKDQGEHWWELRSCTYYDDFEKPKIVYPDIGMSCRFCFDESGLFLTNNAYLIPASDLYLLALLNSHLTFYYLKHICMVLGDADRGGRLRFIYQYMQDLPIRRINFTTPTDERDRQLEKAKTLYQLCLNKGSVDCVLGFVKYHLTADPERADLVHDLLAFLAEQMVEMNRAKGEEIRGFLHWLEREIGVEIDTLKNKTAIQSYFGLSLDGLLDILKKNRRSIAVDPSSRDFQESLEREFTASCAKLNPLLTRIQGTDTLIDLVVYQLYGLTDEEIVVVEGEV
jgi:type I restriction-modification system DNA methylase subunit